ncbi:hypothetical protein J2810_004228 [Chryseobacterium rhizosphaerae]|uniref:HNH endonuclease signature motif containing protein n=1 Tax=Chryseobacterium rhizosphaerae TaxID=395937 RepID=UPI00285AEC7D|nr:HNH endonuclease signature motif containing protein [Chryseobacterium rhizosphaerae]MDR6548141.1 hypothetical protein [Chryseobacterium rhizosphaerae]
MNCSRGAASPDTFTQKKLFADSAGYCQNPGCNKNLFIEIGDSKFQIAEMAHIISAGDKGPRAEPLLTATEKGDFDNLILLCPTCHTIIDKAEEQYPVALINEWKKSHSKKIEGLFNIKKFTSRANAREAITPMLNENKYIFITYGPMSDEQFNPESETPKRWILKVHQHILPNNRKLYKIIDQNYHLLNSDEIETVEAFKQHVLDFEERHIENADIDAAQFPQEFSNIFL